MYAYLYYNIIFRRRSFSTQCNCWAGTKSCSGGGKYGQRRVIVREKILGVHFVYEAKHKILHSSFVVRARASIVQSPSVLIVGRLPDDGA